MKFIKLAVFILKHPKAVVSGFRKGIANARRRRKNPESMPPIEEVKAKLNEDWKTLMDRM